MRARSKELLDRSLAAMLSAIEIFNKPDFAYREDAFAILVINSWELLIKAKWIADHNNKLNSIYVIEKAKKKDGSSSKLKKIKTTRSGNPLTHSIDHLAKKLVETKELSPTAWENIQALLEIRDTAIHFYNVHGNFAVRLQEIGMAAVRNYTFTSQDWFNVDFSKYNLYILPVGFIPVVNNIGLVLNREELNFIKFIEQIEKKTPGDDKFAVSISIDVNYSRSKAADALKIQNGDSPVTVNIKLSEEQLRDKYPLSYGDVTKECKTRYTEFKRKQEFNDLMRQFKEDSKYAHMRELYPGNPKSPKTHFYSKSIFTELDKYYLTIRDLIG